MRIFFTILIMTVLGSGLLQAGGPDRDFDYSPKSVKRVLDIQQKAAFMHFWECADANGMIHAGSDIHNETITAGGSGFGVMAVIAGAERGWISREKALKRISKTMDFLGRAERMHGVWSHWMTPDGYPVRFGKQIEAGDLVETAFMMTALLCVQEYFTGDTSQEKKLRDDIDALWNDIDWNFYTGGEQRLYWAWDRTTGEYHLPVKAWNEALITYILALAAPEGHAISPETYRNGWIGEEVFYHPQRKYYGYPLPMGAGYGGPMFLSHYSFLAMDPRKMEDGYVNYFHNGVRHAMVQRHYCIHEAPEEYGYDEYNWGLTACSGPLRPVKKGYKARTPGRDDGVIAPTAALASMPYVPFYAIQVLMELHYNRPELNTMYGFGDAYSIVDGWNEKGIIAIDQGPMVIMIENYRSGLFWRLLSGNSRIAAGLKAAGIGSPEYGTGFQHAIKDNVTGLYDMIRHPDRGMYELDFCIEEPGEVSFSVRDTAGNEVWSAAPAAYSAGEHVLSFDSGSIVRGETYRVEMTCCDGSVTAIDVRLH